MFQKKRPRATKFKSLINTFNLQLYLIKPEWENEAVVPFCDQKDIKKRVRAREREREGWCKVRWGEVRWGEMSEWVSEWKIFGFKLLVNHQIGSLHQLWSLKWLSLLPCCLLGYLHHGPICLPLSSVYK